jgi:hypothetical protein
LITEVVALLAGVVVCGCLAGVLVVSVWLFVDVALLLLPERQPATTATEATATTVTTETFRATCLTVDDHPAAE